MGQGEYKGCDDLVYKGYFESNKLKNGSISFSKEQRKYKKYLILDKSIYLRFMTQMLL